MSKPRYPIGHVKEIIVYKNDVVVKHAPTSRPKHFVRGKKKAIAGWTTKSRKKLAFVASNTSVDFDAMVTLTYPSGYPCDGRIVKGHLAAFLQWMRRRIKGLSYLWFIEFQKRGAPHYHVLYTKKGVRLGKTDVSRRWYEIVGSEDGRHLVAGTRVETVRNPEGLRHYAVKYAMKMHQKDVPEGYEHVGRFWGHSADVKPKFVARRPLSGIDDLRDAIDKGGRYGANLGVYSVFYNASSRVDFGKPDRDLTGV